MSGQMKKIKQRNQQMREETLINSEEEGKIIAEKDKLMKIYEIKQKISNSEKIKAKNQENEFSLFQNLQQSFKSKTPKKSTIITLSQKYEGLIRGLLLWKDLISQKQMQTLSIDDILQFASYRFQMMEKEIQASKQVREKSEKQQKKNIPSLNLGIYSYCRPEKSSTVEKLQKAKGAISQGLSCLKYCYYREKTQYSRIYVSGDFQYFIYVPENKSPRFENMSEYRGIMLGAKTTNFKQYLTKSYKISQDLAFSILFAHRSFDFVLHSKSQRDTFTEAIKLVRQNN